MSKYIAAAIGSKENVADIFMKALTRPQFQYLVEKVGMAQVPKNSEILG